MDDKLNELNWMKVDLESGAVPDLTHDRSLHCFVRSYCFRKICPD